MRDGMELHRDERKAFTGQLAGVGVLLRRTGAGARKDARREAGAEDDELMEFHAHST